MQTGPIGEGSLRAMRRLEQVTALVVAAGLAIVSYWLFFSWAGGGGYSRPKQRPRAAIVGVEPLARHGHHQGLKGHRGL